MLWYAVQYWHTGWSLTPLLINHVHSYHNVLQKVLVPTVVRMGVSSVVTSGMTPGMWSSTGGRVSPMEFHNRGWFYVHVWLDNLQDVKKCFSTSDALLVCIIQGYGSPTRYFWFKFLSGYTFWFMTLNLYTYISSNHFAVDFRCSLLNKILVLSSSANLSKFGISCFILFKNNLRAGSRAVHLNK